jgi:hypothetical protein
LTIVSQTYVISRGYVGPALPSSNLRLKDQFCDRCTSSSAIVREHCLTWTLSSTPVWSYLIDTSVSDACVSSNCLRTLSKPYPQHLLWNYLRDTSVSDACVSSNCLKTLHVSKVSRTHVFPAIVRGHYLNPTLNTQCLRRMCFQQLSEDTI